MMFEELSHDVRGVLGVAVRALKISENFARHGVRFS